MHLKVAALDLKPMVNLIQDKNKGILKAEGIFGDFLEFVCSKLNFSYSIQKPKDNEWGVFENGNWTGMYGMILNKEVDMILSPSIITYDRMEIVEYSESLFTDDAAILSSPSRRKYYKDILAHISNIDGLTWLLLFLSTLLVALFISLLRKICFVKAFGMVLRALLYKPVKSKLPLNMGTLLLIIYFYGIIFFWLSINKVIGAYLVTKQPENLIDSIEDLVRNKDVIPTVGSGSAFESIFQNENEPNIRLLWKRMQKDRLRGLVKREVAKSKYFVNSIIDKKRVYIGTSLSLQLNVIHHCVKRPELNLYISRNLFIPSQLALAFRLDFDRKIICKINKIILSLKEMGTINAQIRRALINEITNKTKKRSRQCVFNSMRLSASISGTMGLLEDALSLFFAYIYAVLITFIVLLIELMTNKLEVNLNCRLKYTLKRFSSRKTRTVYRRNRETNYKIVSLANKFDMKCI